MALVPVSPSPVDDFGFLSLFPSQSAVSPYYMGFGGSPFYDTTSLAAYTGQRSVQAHTPQMRSTNPFSRPTAHYQGPVGGLNQKRPPLRPEHDRLDKLVKIAVAKIDQGCQQLRLLADEGDSVRNSMQNSDTGGSKELREQLRLANKEIHRLRTLLIQEGGAGDLDSLGMMPPARPPTTQQVQQQQAQQQYQQQYHQMPPERPPQSQHQQMQATQQLQMHMPQQQQMMPPPQPPQRTYDRESVPDTASHVSGDDFRGLNAYNSRQYSFFGLMVADGIRFRDEYAGKHEYGAVKVVKVWGPSALAGIMPMDFITHIDDQHVSSLTDFNRVVANIEPNQPVDIVVERNTHVMTFTVNTSNTDIVPGTITHQNIVHAHLLAENDPNARLRARPQEDNTLHL